MKKNDKWALKPKTGSFGASCVVKHQSDVQEYNEKRQLAKLKKKLRRYHATQP